MSTYLSSFILNDNRNNIKFMIYVARVFHETKSLRAGSLRSNSNMRVRIPSCLQGVSGKLATTDLVVTVDTDIFLISKCTYETSLKKTFPR